MPSSPLQPRGPLPARVYWTRRLVLLSIALVLVAGLARILGGSSDGSEPDGDKATTAGSTTASSPSGSPTTERVKKKRRKKQTPTAPPLAEPTGACLSSDIVVTPVVAPQPTSDGLAMTFNLRTKVSAACTWAVAPDSLTVSITSGDDDIWSSRECPAAIAAQDVVVRQAADTPVALTWDLRRSDDGCTAAREWVKLGFYHVEAAALGGEPTDVQFELVQPAGAVITKTVTPKPQPTNKGNGKGKKNKPGAQETGNSAG